ncbi:hypothetical protein GGTG_14250 [Gaeumannomyces tritici R3-111a-1]|uniref:Uncharacterized protein n=1 Tax=Gaeumannomyces tritici (strain R3-111a-1) TaxID=644352 RepID=J3PL14_GAET3|nr:hypothetical protein GGTG_14250 [Gaeumannomyces tritici R3-111a-1]EJT68172.1 hypothetical protein GGTG_14250 [Gaeumannomyces tritici R3-111a-1]
MSPQLSFPVVSPLLSQPPDLDVHLEIHHTSRRIIDGGRATGQGPPSLASPLPPLAAVRLRQEEGCCH